LKRLCVRDLRGPLDDRTFATLAGGTRIQWRTPLTRPDLERATEWLRTHPDAGLRLYGLAAEQIHVLATDAFAPARLVLDPEHLRSNIPPVRGVGDLTLEGAPMDLASILAAVPALEVLQADFRGEAFDFGVLARVPHLRRLSLARVNWSGEPATQCKLSVLELRDARVDGLDGLLRVPSLRALRLCAVERLRSIDALAHHENLRLLALEKLPHLESLDVLATLPQLESLDISGLWQFSIADAAVITSLHQLRRLAIDIGGRRKNVEISKRMQRAKPSPFDIRDAAYDFTMS
jgi:hypothetical protein